MPYKLWYQFNFDTFAFIFGSHLAAWGFYSWALRSGITSGRPYGFLGNKPLPAICKGNVLHIILSHQFPEMIVFVWGILPVYGILFAMCFGFILSGSYVCGADQPCARQVFYPWYSISVPKTSTIIYKVYITYIFTKYNVGSSACLISESLSMQKLLRNLGSWAHQE